MSSDPDKMTVGIVVTSLGGVGFISVVVWVVLRTIRRRSWSKAAGDVVAMNADDSGGYAPVVVYTPAPGESVRIEGSVMTSPARYQVGDKVVVVFDPSDPQGAVIDRALEHYFMPALLGFLALVMALAGLAIALVD